MTRQVYVIRWTKVFHFHLLLSLNDLRPRVTVQITLAPVIQYLELSPLYSSSIFPVNRRILISSDEPKHNLCHIIRNKSDE